MCKTEPKIKTMIQKSRRPTRQEMGYDERWLKARRSFLRDNPLCVYCRNDGRLTPAEVVDHIIPHKQDRELFWDRDNWQALCKPCHDKHKALEESRGYGVRIGLDGWPTDPRHPANRTGGAGEKE